MRTGTVGIDVGGTHVRAGAVVGGRVLEVARRTHDVPGGGNALSYESLLDAIETTVNELADRHDVASLGISMAGTLSADRTTVISNAHRAWEGKTLPADLASRTGLPVRMENDGNCAAWAEYISGSGVGWDPFVMLTLGTGVGGGSVANGQLVLGRHGIAGELGHICIVEPDGFLCDCGAYGCLEQYASGRSMINRFAAGPEGSWRGAADWPFSGRPAELRTAEALLSAKLAAHDPWALRVIRDAGRSIGAGIAGLTRVLDLGKVAIGGGASVLGVPLLDAIRAGVADYPGLPTRRLNVQVASAHHGEHAGLVGAALLADNITVDSTTRDLLADVTADIP